MEKQTKRQQEWAALKYLILSKSQQDYRSIRKLFSEQGWDDKKEQQFRSYLQHALAEEPKKGNSLNAYQHIWGYFKHKANDNEREKYEELLDSFSLAQNKLGPFLKELTLKYEEPYLRQSKLLFPEEEK
ncbi:YbgA family protein [Enterococcus sp. AZ101]|uniref:YbgA family protein n=1 Tax=Enterococcus sp. AZ101 TaxID=2774742 RepID=UPI003D2A2D48